MMHISASAPYRWWVLTASTATQLCAALASQGIGVWGGFAQQRFGLTHAQLGLLAGLANGIPVIGLFYIGRLLDRWGERAPVFAGMAVLAAALVILGGATTFTVLLVAMSLIGMGYSPIQPGGSKAIYHWFAPAQRGVAMGIRQAALPLGGALAAALLPALMAHGGWWQAMAVAAALIAAGGVFFVLVYRNPPLPARVARTASPWRGFTHYLSQRTFRHIAAIGIALVATQTAVSVFWVLYLAHRFGLSLDHAANELVVVLTAGCAGRMVLSALSDRLTNGRGRTVKATAAIVAALLAVTAFVPVTIPGWGLVLMSGLVGFFSFGWYGPWVVWVSDTAPHEAVGEVLGLAMALNQIAIALMPLAFGYLLDGLSGYTVPWLGCGLLPCLALCWNGRRASLHPGYRPLR